MHGTNTSAIRRRFTTSSGSVPDPVGPGRWYGRCPKCAQWVPVTALWERLTKHRQCTSIDVRGCLVYAWFDPETVGRTPLLVNIHVRRRRDLPADEFSSVVRSDDDARGPSQPKEKKRSQNNARPMKFMAIVTSPVTPEGARLEVSHRPARELLRLERDLLAIPPRMSNEHVQTRLTAVRQEIARYASGPVAVSIDLRLQALPMRPRRGAHSIKGTLGVTSVVSGGSPSLGRLR